MKAQLDRRGYERLREAATTPRERLVVRLIGEAGVGPGEQTRMRPGDVDRRRFDGSVHHFLPVRDGDGAVSRRTYLPADLARSIDEYAATEGVDPDSRLIDVTPRRVQMLVSEVAARADGDRLADVSSGDLRRYFAKRLLVEEGVDPRVVRTIGGWDRLDVLDRYLDPADNAEIAAAFSDSDRPSPDGRGLSFDGAPGAVGLELDPDGRIVGSSGGIERLLGRERNSVVGSSFGQLFTDDARERARPKEILDSASSEGVSVETCSFRRSDGDRRRLSALVSSRGSDPLSGFVVVAWAADADDGRTTNSFHRAVAAAGQPICFTSLDGEIEYVNPAFEELVGYTQTEVVGRSAADILSSGEDPEAYYEGLRRAVSEKTPWTGQVTLRRKGGDRVHVRQTVAPAGGDEPEFVVIVATNVTERVRRERSLARRCETLEGLEGLVADINAAGRELIDASTRSEIEAAICASLADSDAYLAAWIGGVDPGESTLRPREAAGAPVVDDSTLDVESAALSSALETGEPTVAGSEFPPDVLGPFAADDLPETRATGLVPLAYGETTYGVLVVFTDRGTAFGDRERTLLSDLGAHVGHAITAIERRKLLLADTVVELEFDCTDDAAFLVSATAEHGCRCSIEAVVPVAEGSLLFYATLSGASPDAFLDTATAAPGVVNGRYIREYDGRSLLELTVEGGSPALKLTEIGATIREGVADSGEQTIRAEIAQETGVRSVVRGLQAAFPDTSLRSKRSVDRPVETLAEFQDSLSESLTDKQRSALRAAYFAGYFDWPRGSTAEEVADSMGVSSPTLHNHLRKAERKLLSSFFDHTREHIGGAGADS